MSILNDIISNKRKEIAEAKVTSSILDFEQSPLFSRDCISMTKRLDPGFSNRVIAEFKRKSPSKGWFVDPGLSPAPVIKKYSEMNVAGISVLTDEVYFGGRTADLGLARQLTDLPLLRKDFIIDEWQVYEAKAIGADVILLIAACNEKDQISSLMRTAHALGLQVLLELHDASELDKLDHETDMIGINSRNLQTFDVNIQNTIELFNHLPPGIPVIAESGMDSNDRIEQMLSLGFAGVLAGEMYMREFSQSHTQ